MRVGCQAFWWIIFTDSELINDSGALRFQSKINSASALKITAFVLKNHCNKYGLAQ